jgi:hypothetical protein
MKTLKQIREASGGKEAYQKFFNSLLKKFGVDSPSELEGDKKKKFFNALDKGWESDDKNDANEATIHISNELSEKLKAGKGSLKGKDAIGVDVDWDNVGDEKKWIKQAKSKHKVIIKKDVGKYHSGASISGKKSDIIKFLQGPMYGGVEDRDIEDMWPWLLENKDDFKDDTDVSDDRGNYSGVDEVHKSLADIKKNKAGDDDDLDPDTTTDIDEKAPPGMEKVVLKLKADGKTDEEAFAIAWGIYNDKARQKRNYYDEGFFGKSYPVMDAGQRGKVEKIAKKYSGNMARALVDIEKIRAGLSDSPDVMDILRKANEMVEKVKMVQGNKQEYWKRIEAVMKRFGIKSVTELKPREQKKYFAAVDKALGHSLESVEETVAVDRRTKGFKEAMYRREKAKAKREAKKREAAAKLTYDSNSYVDKGNYEYDGEVEEVISRTSDMVMYGKRSEDAAANSNAEGGVDMAPEMGKKKKKVAKRVAYT